MFTISADELISNPLEMFKIKIQNKWYAMHQIRIESIGFVDQFEWIRHELKKEEKAWWKNIMKRIFYLSSWATI